MNQDGIKFKIINLFKTITHVFRKEIEMGP